MADAQQRERIEELERLEQEHKVKETELAAVQYELFTEIPDIEGHRMYPLTDTVREEIACHERRVAELRRQEADLSRERAALAERIRVLRDRIVLDSH
jgi:hypothetical protein